MNWEPLWALGLSTASGAVRRLPDGPRYATARAVGRGVSALFPAKKKAVEKNLEWINAWAGTRFTSRRVFENFGMTLADFLSQGNPEIVVEGRERAEAAWAAGKGALFLTSHLGNWELGGRVLAAWGRPVTAVYQPYRSAAMQNYIQRRRAAGLSYLAVGKGAAHGVAQVLGRGETVALLADRPFGEPGERVRLCGRPARLPRGPYLFSVRSGAPIVPGFVLMDSPGKYRTVLEEPLWPEGKGAMAVQILLDKMAQVLEKYLARCADQWYCFEPVWEIAEDGSGSSRSNPGV